MHSALATAALALILAWQAAAGSPTAAAAAAATRPSIGAAPGARQPLATLTRQRIDAILKQLEGDGDFPAARAALAPIFDTVIAYAGPRDLELFREAALALRLVEQLAAVDPGYRLDLYQYLRGHADLAAALAFAVQPAHEKPAQVYATLQELRKTRADLLPRYPNLTAALCVVHDGPALVRQLNENSTTAPEAGLLFDYYVKHEKRMLFGVSQVPVELLVYVVDGTTPVAEMEWALGRYAGNKEVGRLFFAVNYDTAHYQNDREKQVTKRGYALENILKYGGVCVDQAYFASAVGKAIGVPTAWVSAQAGAGGHAWVGFLQSRSDRAWWNFDVGRYPAFKGLAGQVRDPQTRANIPDAFVAILAESVMVSARDRQIAAAMNDAARRLMPIEAEYPAQKTTGLEGPSAGWTPAPPENASNALARPRKVSTDTILALVEMGLNKAGAHLPGWYTVAELADKGRLTLAQKRRWADLLTRFCGDKYPDFVLAVLTPMIRSVENPDEQLRLWGGIQGMFRQRPDLVARVLIHQGNLCEDHRQPQMASDFYQEVLKRYANDGPFIVEALQGLERNLKDRSPAAVAALYQRTWGLVKRPDADAAGAFAIYSVWYRLGELLVVKLETAEKPQEAAKVRHDLDRVASQGKRKSGR